MTFQSGSCANQAMIGVKLLLLVFVYLAKFVQIRLIRFSMEMKRSANSIRNSEFAFNRFNAIPLVMLLLLCS